LWVSGGAKHAYKKPGTFTVKARALPGCSGEASATIVVKAALVEGVAGLDAPARTGLVNKIAIAGKSGACAMKVDFGDGKSETVNATFPGAGGKHVVNHVYDSPGRKQLSVKGLEGCGGSVTGNVEVPYARLTGVKWTGNVEQQQTFSLTSDGGICPVHIEWGDGAVEERRVVTFTNGTAKIIRPYYNSKGKRVTASFRGLEGCMGIVADAFTAN
jgi:hypothetical protein